MEKGFSNETLLGRFLLFPNLGRQYFVQIYVKEGAWPKLWPIEKS
jgi:hypothetical protein